MKKLLFIALLILVGCAQQDVMQINLKDHNQLALHIHPHVQIVIDGQDQVIPMNIGITSLGMRVIHTHDTTGKLHVESPVMHQFYLADFFTIWGKRFDDQCIFDKCKDETHDLKLFVNGEESDLFGALPLKDGDQIEIVYETK